MIKILHIGQHGRALFDFCNRK